ncbi:methylaspartate mutase subunit S [Bacteroides sp. OttesenSCG-928-E20]|nr:methylaspartate mutase subunit S [Bacteroides sp. OttesenSCG-928-E20]
MEKKTIVTGVIGADVHAVGNKIIAYALEREGFDVVNLGVMVSQEEYIAAALETNAHAVLVSSLYGHGEIDCQGLRQKCDEAGLKNIPLMAGGNLVVGKQDFVEVEKRFIDMGFNKAYPPGTAIETTIADLKEMLGI